MFSLTLQVELSCAMLLRQITKPHTNGRWGVLKSSALHLMQLVAGWKFSSCHCAFPGIDVKMLGMMKLGNYGNEIS